MCNHSGNCNCKYDFCHLHRHCEASIQDGVGKIEDGVKYAKEMGHKAVAITDHGNLISYVRFFNEAKAQDIKHIFGLEAYLCDDMTLKDKEHKSYNHCTILVKNQQGFQNILKLNNISQRHGFYYRPRVDWDTLFEHKDGLIILSGCVLGRTSQYILNKEYDRADEWTRMMKGIMGDDYYMELMPSDFPAQREANQYLLELSRKFEIPGVITTDAHYVRKEDYDAQKTMMLISAGATLEDLAKQQEQKATAEQRGEKFDEKDKIWIFESDQYWMKNADEIMESWQKWHSDYYPKEEFEKHLNESGKIADKIELVTLDDSYKVPHAIVPDGYTHENYFIKLLNDGMVERGLNDSNEHWDRLTMEVNIIKEKGLVDYFLVNADVIGWAKRNNIFVGPARGSAGGSLVCYLLHITEIDPLKYDLLFERFLDLGRKEMPDVDTDFEIEERNRVKEYIAQRYGEEHVANIAALGNFRARNIIRDVCRVYNYTPAQINEISKEIPQHAEFFEDKLINPDTGKEVASDIVNKMFSDNPDIKRIAKTLYGQIRHISKHAAGVVITDRPLSECVATIRVGDDVMTAWTDGIYNKELSQLNVLKLDILGLKTLTIIKRACEFSGLDYESLHNVDFDDPNVYKIINDQKLIKGIFQFDSYSGERWFYKMQPQCFNDIVALAALDRPGPIDSGKTEEYIQVMHGEMPQTQYNHHAISEVLDETYGAIVYQEQLMTLGKKYAGFTAAEASALRKNLVKGTHSESGKTREAQQRIELHQKFIDGAIANGSNEQEAETVWELMVTFARYGFNKAHSVGYAVVSFWTMYMKVYYPKEFYAALLTYANDDETRGIVFEMKSRNIDLRHPDINKSLEHFTPDPDDEAVLFGLGKIKYVGGNAQKEIITKRPFTSFQDFCDKVEKRSANKRVKDALIRSGACQSLSNDIGGLLSQHDAMYLKKNELPKQFEYTDAMRLDDEKQFLGIELSRGFALVDMLKEKPETIFGLIGDNEKLAQRINNNYGRFIHPDLGTEMYRDRGTIKSVTLRKNKRGNNYIALEIKTFDKKPLVFFVQHWDRIYSYVETLREGHFILVAYTMNGDYRNLQYGEVVYGS